MSKSEHQLRVEEFMDKAGQMRHTIPTVPPAKVCILGARLILEEALETIAALGVNVELHYPAINRDGLPLVFDRCQFIERGSDAKKKVSVEEIADGCGDVRVVSTWVLSACGVHDNELMDEIDGNNLAKFGPGSSISPEGKLTKPPGHQPPDIARVLRDQGSR